MTALTASIRPLVQSTMAAARNAVWPFVAPFDSPAVSKPAGLWWKVASAITVFPFAAALHNGFFHRPTCMMHNFGGDYNIATLTEWFLKDPSLAWAIALAFTMYYIGLRHAIVRALAAPLFLAFAPFSLWIWDIPFTSHYICEHFHDAKLTLPSGAAVTGKHVLLVCLILYQASLLFVVPRFMGWPAAIRNRAAGAAHNPLGTHLLPPTMRSTVQPRSPDFERF